MLFLQGLVFFKLALRVDVSRVPAIETLVRRGANARAADGLISQSKIAAQKEPERAAAGPYYIGPAFEHAIWQSEMSLKGSGGLRHEVLCPRHVYGALT